MNDDCLICGRPLGAARFTVLFKSRRLHVVCEQEILNEGWYGAGIIIEYGIHGARGTHKGYTMELFRGGLIMLLPDGTEWGQPLSKEYVMAWNHRMDMSRGREQAREMLRS